MSCCTAHTSQDAVLRLEQLGFTVLPALLSTSDCEAIRALVDSALGKASDDEYTRIHNPRLRKDLPLRLHPFNGSLATLFSARGGLLKAVLEKVPPSPFVGCERNRDPSRTTTVSGGLSL